MKAYFLRHLSITILACILIAGCNGLKITKPMLSMAVASSNKLSTALTFADSCEKKTALPYVMGGSPSQVVDLYYAPSDIRKGVLLIDIHGGFYVAGKRENNRTFASAFLRDGFDVALLEYRLNDGTLDVQDELGDCAAALDYLASNAPALGLDRSRMFLTGDSAGGHLALYMAEGAENPAMPVRPLTFRPRGVMLNCPAYDFASFSNPAGFTQGTLEWFIGPRYEDKAWLESMSPRTFIGSYTGPLFVSTCKNDFIRDQSMLIKADCDSLGRSMVLVDIVADSKKVGHVHNVINLSLPESVMVNDRMKEFMESAL